MDMYSFNNDLNYIALGNDFLEQNKLAEAEQVFLECAKKFPASFRAKNRLGFVALQAGDTELAIRRFTTAIMEHAGNTWGHLGLVQSFCKCKLYEEAVKQYYIALTKCKDQDELLKTTVKLFVNESKHNLAIDLILHSLKQEKKIAFVIGNCQASPLSFLLKSCSSFSKSYYLLEALPPIHEQPDKFQELVLEEIVPKVSLAISQPILKSSFPLNSEKLKSSCNKVLIYPNCYFISYFPDMVYLKQNGETIRKIPLIDYHSLFIYSCFLNSISINSCSSMLIDGSWINLKKMECALEDDLNEFKRRCSMCDINIYDYFLDNYKKRPLFHVMNHPIGEMIKEIAMKIFDKLNLNIDKFDVNTNNFLCSTRWIVPKPLRNLFLAILK